MIGQTLKICYHNFMQPPVYIKKYFWDTDFSQLDLDKNRSYVISRIFEYGDERAVIWALHYFDKEDVKKTLRESRVLSPKSGNFWALFFSLRKSDFRCFRKSSLKLQSSHWIR